MENKFYEKSVFGIEIAIKITKPGIYIFPNSSSSGKTYLVKLFNTLREDGEKVDTFTYSDLLKGLSLENCLKKEAKIIIIDRYDMYYDEKYIRLFDEAAKTKIVLVDLKNDFKLASEYTDCSIKFSDGRIEVNTY